MTCAAMQAAAGLHWRCIRRLAHPDRHVVDFLSAGRTWASSVEERSDQPCLVGCFGRRFEPGAVQNTVQSTMLMCIRISDFQQYPWQSGLALERWPARIACLPGLGQVEGNALCQLARMHSGAALLHCTDGRGQQGLVRCSWACRGVFVSEEVML